jgi:hypothetical protein
MRRYSIDLIHEPADAVPRRVPAHLDAQAMTAGQGDLGDFVS